MARVMRALASSTCQRCGIFDFMYSSILHLFQIRIDSNNLLITSVLLRLTYPPPKSLEATATATSRWQPAQGFSSEITRISESNCLLAENDSSLLWYDQCATPFNRRSTWVLYKLPTTPANNRAIGWQHAPCWVLAHRIMELGGWIARGRITLQSAHGVAEAL